MNLRTTFCGLAAAMSILAPLRAQAYGVWVSGNACAPNGVFADASDLRTLVSGDTGQLPCAMDGVPGTPVWTQSAARADLGSATVRTQVWSDTRGANLDIGQGGAHGHGANAYAEFADAITFYVLPSPFGPPPGSSTPITLRVSVDGSFAGEYAHFDNLNLMTVNSTDPGWGRRQARAEFTWEGPYGPGGSPFVKFAGVGISGSPGIQPANLIAVMQLSGVITDGARLDLDVAQYTEVDAGSWGEGHADFMHTARLSFDLPAGWGFTSESGVLLSPVPQPPTVGLWSFGLLALLFASRRRQQGHAVRR